MNRKKRVLTVAILMVAALLLLFHQLFHEGVTAEAVDFFFICFAFIILFTIGITCACPPLRRPSYSFNRRSPPPTQF